MSVSHRYAERGTGRRLRRLIVLASSVVAFGLAVFARPTRPNDAGEAPPNVPDDRELSAPASREEPKAAIELCRPTRACDADDSAWREDRTNPRAVGANGRLPTTSRPPSRGAGAVP